MKFGDRLQQTIDELGISQSQLSKLTGIGRSSICQYLSGKNEPSDKRKEKIATDLGLETDYFFDEPREAPPLFDIKIPRLRPRDVAKMMGVAEKTVAQGLKEGVFPWGYAIQGEGGRCTYFINAKRFAAIEMVELEGI